MAFERVPLRRVATCPQCFVLRLLQSSSVKVRAASQSAGEAPSSSIEEGPLLGKSIGRAPRASSVSLVIFMISC